MGMKISLPDFEDMYSTIDKIKEYSLKKLAKELEIKAQVSKVVAEVMTNPQYFLNGKAPSMNFVEKTYFFSGLDGELLPLRDDLAGIVSTLEHLKLKFSLDNSMIDVWRTMEANKRRSIE